MIQKEMKYNLHFIHPLYRDDVRGDFLRPPQGTTPAIVGKGCSDKKTIF